MKRVLIISTGSSIRSLKNYKKDGYELVYKSLARALKVGPKQFVDEVVGEFRLDKKRIDGVLGLTDTSCLIAAEIAKRLGLCHPPIRSLLTCQNKYIFRSSVNSVMRSASSSYGLVKRSEMGNHTHASLIKLLKQNNLSFPLILKPVKGALSQGVYKIESEDSFFKVLPYLEVFRSKHIFYSEILEVLGERNFGERSLNDFVIENYFEGDIQITIDGYVQDSVVSIFGFTLSVFVPNTMSFDRFEFPFEFKDKKIHDKVVDVCQKCVLTCGLENSLFNAEFVVDTKSKEMKIIEINSRPSAQFLYLIQSVIGINPLDVGLDMAVGKKSKITLNTRKDEVAICFILRKKQDARVVDVPSEKEISDLKKNYKSLRYACFVKKGKRLSSYPQDTDTFRYAQVKLVGKNKSDVEKEFVEIKSKLSFVFE